MKSFPGIVLSLCAALTLGTATAPSAAAADGITTLTNFCVARTTPPAPLPGGRVLVVDRHQTTGYPSITAAKAAMVPGDTIWVAKGSGPYHEEVSFTSGGTASAPVVLDGNCETIDGTEPLTGFTVDPATGRRVVTLPKSADHRAGISIPKYWPQLIIHNGRRIIQNGTTSAFSEDIRVVTIGPDSDGVPMTQLQLPVGDTGTGWVRGGNTAASW